MPWNQLRREADVRNWTDLAVAAAIIVGLVVAAVFVYTALVPAGGAHFPTIQHAPTAR